MYGMYMSLNSYEKGNIIIGNTKIFDLGIDEITYHDERTELNGGKRAEKLKKLLGEHPEGTLCITNDYDVIIGIM